MVCLIGLPRRKRTSTHPDVLLIWGTLPHWWQHTTRLCLHMSARPLVHSRRDEGGILDLALETDEGGGCASLGFHDGSGTSFRLQPSCCFLRGMIISGSYRLFFLTWRMSCLQLLTAWKQSCQSFTTWPSMTAVRGGEKKGVKRRWSMSDKEEKCSKMTDPLKKKNKNWWNSCQTTWYLARNKRQPVCLSELFIFFGVWGFSSDYGRFDYGNLTGYWLYRILSCKNLGFDWSFTHIYVETSYVRKLRVFLWGSVYNSEGRVPWWSPGYGLPDSPRNNLESLNSGSSSPSGGSQLKSTLSSESEDDCGVITVSLIICLIW